jgi:hypothetical protein
MSLVGFIGELGLKRMQCNGKWIMTLAGIMACNLSNIVMEWKLSMECKLSNIANLLVNSVNSEFD